MRQVKERENKLGTRLEIKSYWKPVSSPSPMFVKLMERLLRKSKGNQVGIQESNKNS